MPIQSLKTIKSYPSHRSQLLCFLPGDVYILFVFVNLLSCRFCSQFYTTVPSVIVASRRAFVHVSQFAWSTTRRRSHGHVEDITDIQGK